MQQSTHVEIDEHGQVSASLGDVTAPGHYQVTVMDSGAILLTPHTTTNELLERNPQAALALDQALFELSELTVDKDA